MNRSFIMPDVTVYGLSIAACKLAFLRCDRSDNRQLEILVSKCFEQHEYHHYRNDNADNGGEYADYHPGAPTARKEVDSAGITSWRHYPINDFENNVDRRA